MFQKQQGIFGAIRHCQIKQICLAKCSDFLEHLISHTVQKSSNPLCAVQLSEHYAIICLLFLMKKTAVELIFLISSIPTPIQFIIPQEHSPEPFSTTSNTVKHYNEQCGQSDVPMVIVSDHFFIFCWPRISVWFVLITNLTHFFNVFISLLCMFRATQCSSSAE